MLSSSVSGILYFKTLYFFKIFIIDPDPIEKLHDKSINLNSFFLYIHIFLYYLKSCSKEIEDYSKHSQGYISDKTLLLEIDERHNLNLALFSHNQQLFLPLDEI